MILGAVLAGGQSSRFGSDKALALLDGQSLIERAVAALSSLCDAVVIAGRDGTPDLAACFIADRPRPGMGPLGGLAAALHHARTHDFGAVLSCAVDSLGIDAALCQALGDPPSYIASQPVIGLWPASAAPILDQLLSGEGRHSMRAFAEAIGARPVTPPHDPANVNTPADLAALARGQR